MAASFPLPVDCVNARQTASKFNGQVSGYMHKFKTDFVTWSPQAGTGCSVLGSCDYGALSGVATTKAKEEIQKHGAVTLNFKMCQYWVETRDNVDNPDFVFKTNSTEASKCREGTHTVTAIGWGADHLIIKDSKGPNFPGALGSGNAKNSIWKLDPANLVKDYIGTTDAFVHCGPSDHSACTR